ncbi:MAG: hypothetical protein GWN99_17100 [Gemmatimonadetes bacterium]|uniref:DNRLRE domain-containing protein n=1 Tax=Candidatus Kutchimonas denitrificans TaxID=3056748 RepID=A0AAE5CBL1_9BACT|nr:hypothetical protein [Gemmatimonadota bacterium]NIR74565.1 hypothetical protein [Candidatus Kutchimonas denitrificans]NIS02755.1 hypothetical protein [Gemmatimonadota bacterium]NIT68916.1 hypothetical protein [Gemmatimonadota bacterium]NIU52221.1 hypothetical protein [Gemmatimonadota bacterium]
MRPRLPVVAFLLGALSSVACEREGTVIVEPGEAPGRAAATHSVALTPAMTAWIDSTFSGFTGPANATFLLLQEDTKTLTSRGLIRFEFIQDSVFVFDSLSGPLRFDSARIVLNIDTARTMLGSVPPPPGSWQRATTLQVVEVTQDWDRGSVDWENAVDSVGFQVPWNGGPGGAFGRVLGDTTLTEAADSLVIWLDVDTDSLLRDWLDTMTVNRGIGLVVTDTGSVTLQLPRIEYNIVPESEPDTAIRLSVLATDGTFIFDAPAVGSAAGVLRVGGVEGWRSFLSITVPDSLPVEGTGELESVRGATINRADLFLISRPPPDPPFAADQNFFATAYTLVDDFTVLGAKTPVGRLLAGSDAELQVDSLMAGDTIAMNITRRVQTWADLPDDSVAPPLRLSIRGLFEATTFGFWEFGAADGDPAYAPVLRIVFTPPTEFTLP